MTLAERVLNARRHQKGEPEMPQPQASISSISESKVEVASERVRLEHALRDIQARKERAMGALSSDTRDVAHFREQSASRNESSSPIKSPTNTDVPRDRIVVLNDPTEFRNFAWRRWTARQLDLILGCCFLGIVLIALGYCSVVTGVGLDFWEWINASPVNAWMFFVITISMSFFADALVYAIFKNTLGKKICGISICDMAGHRISAIDYLKRDFKVLIGGYWIFILSIVPFMQQYSRVKVGDSTSYDKGCEYQARPTRKKTWFEIIRIVIVLVRIVIVRNITKEK